MTLVPSSTGTGPFPANPHSLFSFSTSIIFRFHSSKVGMSSGSLQLTLGSASEATGELGSCHTHTHTRGKVSAGRKQLTPREGFTLWEVLASLCGELGAAGELGGGSGWLLVPAVWTLEVFSRTIGGLLWEPEGAFHSGSSFHSKAKIQPEDLKSRLTCRRHKGFPPHSWQEGGRDQ